MTEHTPTTEQMREWFAEPRLPKEPTSIDRHYRYKRMFNRWLSELIRKEREEAWDEAFSQAPSDCGVPCGACELCMTPTSDNPYSNGSNET